MEHMDAVQPLTPNERRELEEYRKRFGPLAVKHVPGPPNTKHIAGPDRTKRFTYKHNDEMAALAVARRKR